jgi:hypothetical protein
MMFAISAKHLMDRDCIGNQEGRGTQRRKPKRTKKNEQTERDKRNSMKSLILDKMKNLQVKSHLVNQTMLSSFTNRTNL